MGFQLQNKSPLRYMASVCVQYVNINMYIYTWKKYQNTAFLVVISCGYFDPGVNIINVYIYIIYK